MMREKLVEVLAEIARFEKRANELLNEGYYIKTMVQPGHKCAAVRRASLDLSKALTELRKW